MKHFIIALLTATMLSSLAAKAQVWKAPASAATTKNPLANNTSVITTARQTYKTTCAPCHGEKGKGDGPAAVALNPKPADHTSATVQGETDGALYWKITNGKGAMQAYKTQLSDNQRWALVNYIRTLAPRR